MKRLVSILLCICFLPIAAFADVDLYSSSQSYVTDNLVRGSDHNHYRAIASVPANTANTDPTTDNGDHWELYKVNANTTLPVTYSTGRFTFLSKALAFVQNAYIGQGAVLT